MNTTDLKTDREKELWRMAYRGECDGHDRAWHRISAHSHRELAILTSAADLAKVDLAKDRPAGAKEAHA